MRPGDCGACDAGAIDLGEHVISVTSDTAILAQASSTRRMLREMVIREILCKPAVLTISRAETSERIPTQLQLESTAETKTLPAANGPAIPGGGTTL